MPEEGRSSDPPVSPRRPASTALQVRRDTDLSTLLFPAEVAPAAADDEVHFRDLWHVVVKRKWSIIAMASAPPSFSQVSTGLRGSGARRV